LAARTICVSNLQISTLSLSQCRASTRSGMRAVSGIALAASSSASIRLCSPFKPCAATMPNSASAERNAFADIVRWRTSSRRVRCRTTTAWLSTLFTGTNRIVGRPTASHTPSASRPSFLLRLT
jgi:hypothetical protein